MIEIILYLKRCIPVYIFIDQVSTKKDKTFKSTRARKPRKQRDNTREAQKKKSTNSKVQKEAKKSSTPWSGFSAEDVSEDVERKMLEEVAEKERLIQLLENDEITLEELEELDPTGTLTLKVLQTLIQSHFSCFRWLT